MTYLKHVPKLFYLFATTTTNVRGFFVFLLVC